MLYSVGLRPKLWRAWARCDVPPSCCSREAGRRGARCLPAVVPRCDATPHRGALWLNYRKVCAPVAPLVMFHLHGVRDREVPPPVAAKSPGVPDPRRGALPLEHGSTAQAINHPTQPLRVRRDSRGSACRRRVAIPYQTAQRSFLELKASNRGLRRYQSNAWRRRATTDFSFRFRHIPATSVPRHPLSPSPIRSGRAKFHLSRTCPGLRSTRSVREPAKRCPSSSSEYRLPLGRAPSVSATPERQLGASNGGCPSVPAAYSDGLSPGDP